MHSSGSDLANIEQDVKKNELGYPILIDTASGRDEASGFGKFAHQLGVSALPHAFLIDGESKIVAQGQLREVLEKADELATVGRQ